MPDKQNNSRPAAMYQMRQSGAALQQIATRFGISREGVRKSLVRHYGSSKVQGLLTATEVAREIGCTRDYVNKLRQQGIILPAGTAGTRTLWKPETIVAITRYKEEHSQRCRICKGPLPTNRRVFCSKACSKEARKYRNWSKEAKGQHNERVRRWVQKHPEQAKQIERRKFRKYHLKYQARKAAERYQSTKYLVQGKCAVPKGTVIKALGCQACRLRVEWQGQIIAVPVGCVKRVAKQS